MTGLVKQKTYEWKDSNIALVGSDTDRKVKKAAAETEEAWKGAGQKVGLQIWRIEKFQVKHWEKERYGEFYEGDSYIILNTYKDKEDEKLLYDVHFWIGKHSTQDEYGTAAYKTVELDTLLDDVPVQHREVQNHESELFKSYFKSFTTLKGGCDTGFKHVEPEKFVKKLLKVRSEKRKTLVTEVPCFKSSVKAGDVYILDEGLTITQFNSEGAAYNEVRRASEVVVEMKENRHGKPKSEVMDKVDESLFLDKLNEGEAEEEEEEEVEIASEPGKLYRVDIGDTEEAFDGTDIGVGTILEPHVLMFDPGEISSSGRLASVLRILSEDFSKLSDASGNIEFTKVKENGGITKKDLDSNDVFIVHVGKEVFVWVGRRASENEKLNGMAYAQKYLQEYSSSQLNPVSVVKEGQKCKAFSVAVSA